MWFSLALFPALDNSGLLPVVGMLIIVFAGLAAFLIRRKKEGGLAEAEWESPGQTDAYRHMCRNNGDMEPVDFPLPRLTQGYAAEIAKKEEQPAAPAAAVRIIPPVYDGSCHCGAAPPKHA